MGFSHLCKVIIRDVVVVAPSLDEILMLLLLQLLLLISIVNRLARVKHRNMNQMSCL